MEYPKIETLYKRDENTFKVRPGELKNKAYSLITEWEFTEKIDGTNIRCIWDGSKLSFAGRTDRATIHKDLSLWLEENVIDINIAFALGPTPAILYGEGYGAGIQKGGGNYSSIKKFILFDVLIDGKYWVNRKGVEGIANALGLDVVDYVGTMTLADATAKVRKGMKSKFGSFQSEGLVGRPAETLFDSRGNRLIVKIKTRDFLND